VFVDLALAGAVPAESAVVAFERWRRLEGVVSARAGTTFLMTLAIPWWAANGDTLTLRQILHLGQSRAQRDADGDRRAAWRYMADAALAYLALAVGDSSEALRRFEELPDCLECDFDRLQTARMLAAAGRDREAHQRLEAVFPTEIKRPPRPSEIFWVLERGRVAQRRGDWRSAAEAYAWVADIWRHADPELRLHVAEARASLERISGGARR
jgi:hypothetical protein